MGIERTAVRATTSDRMRAERCISTNEGDNINGIMNVEGQTQKNNNKRAGIMSIFSATTMVARITVALTLQDLVSNTKDRNETTSAWPFRSELLSLYICSFWNVVTAIDSRWKQSLFRGHRRPRCLRHTARVPLADERFAVG
jgi:hypothetical protein